MNVEPYLYFNGNTEEALHFYRDAIGAEIIAMMRFSDSPVPCSPDMVPPGSEHKVMHSLFQVGESKIMASDGRCNGDPAVFSGITLTINATNDAEAKRLFGALSNGGQVQMPLTARFFASSFGMVADKFGVSWMVLVALPQ